MRKKLGTAEIQVLRLLSFALVEIRAEAHAGNSERARLLADAFHNAPLTLIADGADSTLADVRSRLERHGETGWFDRTLATVR
jgi:hypothetical protein